MQWLIARCAVQVDEHSPLTREWAVLAVRNLCMGNPKIQQDVSELQAVSAVDSAELRQAGLEASIDATTGKVQVQERTIKEGQ